MMVLTLGGVIAPAVSAASSITITPSSTQVALEIGEEHAIELSKFEDGVETGPITDDVEWVSLDESIATVSNGVIKGVEVGTAVIQAIYENSYSVVINVTVKPLLNSIEVFGDSSIELPMGVTARPSITGNYSNGTSRFIQTEGTWTSSDENVVTALNGVLTPVGIGEAEVTFTYRGKEVRLAVEVVHGVIGFWVNDATPTIQINGTHQIEMKEIYSDESIIDIDPDQVVYFGYDPSIVSVSSGGMLTALAEGETVIRAVYGYLPPLEITVTVTVATAPKVVRLSISNANYTLIQGTGVGLPLVTALYNDSNERIIPKKLLEWNTADPTIATVFVDTTSMLDQSMLMAEGLGQTELLITFEGVTLRVPITVIEMQYRSNETVIPQVVRIATDPASVTLKIGNTKKLYANLILDDSSVEPVVNLLKFSSSNPKVVSVDNNGILTAVSIGTATITVRFQQFQATSEVKVVASESKGSVYIFPTEPTPNQPFVINAAIADLDAMRRVLAKGEDNPSTAFNDPLPSWGSESVDRATRMGIITGYVDNTFKANKAITRAEFAKMVSIAFGLESKEGSGFTDTQKHWAARAIEALQGSGVISGYGDGSFHPDQPITRAEMVAILSRLTSFLPSSGDKFTDTKGHWASDAINVFGDAGIISGKGEGQFNPDGEATRVESVKIIIALLDALTNKQESPIDESNDV